MMQLFRSAATTKTESTVNLPPATDEEKALTAELVRIAEEQRIALENLSQLAIQPSEIEAGFQAAESRFYTGEEIDKIVKDQLAREERTRALEDELVNRQLDLVQRGISATPEQIAQLEDLAQQQIGLGRSEIEQFQQESLQRLRGELAPGLGLRPGDTPIIDRGQLVGREATRQFGQLERGVRAEQFRQLVELPFRSLEAERKQLVSTQGAAEAATQFHRNLMTQAALRRASLFGAPVEASALGLQAVSRGIGVAQAPRLQETMTSGSVYDPTRLIGALSQGAGAAAGAM